MSAGYRELPPDLPVPEDDGAADRLAGQSCAFRDAVAAFSRLGVAVVGISAQDGGEQREFAEREHIPFPLLSDSALQLAGLLSLPTFEVEGMSLYRRLTFVAEEGRIVKVFYPVFPPDRNATEVLAWLKAKGGPRE